jgi:ribosomal protein S18 acetylase RimI-like enzyme
MKKNLSIRPFMPADQKATRDLILEGLGGHFGILNPELNPDLDDIYANYPNKGFLFVVCEIEGILVGTGALIAERARTGRIVRVSVANSCRRQGIGRLITDHLIAAAPQYGYKHIVVETNDDWFEAIHLYKSCGFKECDRCCGEIHMIKVLSSTT